MYIHPISDVNVEAYKCDEPVIDLDEWEEEFKAEVRALGGEWATLEITCIREVR